VSPGLNHVAFVLCFCKLHLLHYDMMTKLPFT
jgi:hypothetical protein